jgi:hypothetical protein
MELSIFAKVLTAQEVQIMKVFTTLFVSIVLVSISGCEGKRAADKQVATDSARVSSQARPEAGRELKPKGDLSKGLITTEGGRPEQLLQVSMEGAAAAQAASLAAERKIIRNADLTIETDSPADGLRKISSIAEGLGGFVVTSEFKNNDGAGQPKPAQTVTVVARIPARQFDEALEQVRATGTRVVQQKISGQDVSEEYLDLEARIRTKKALEAQFLEIMKQAHKVSDALEVQSQLADVRTEIERLEGRRRFIENQSALSTITATLQLPAPLVAATTTGFRYSIKQAFGDAVDTAASIILFVVQAVIVLIPVAVLIVLPGWLVWRVLRRRFVPTRKAEPVAES